MADTERAEQIMLRMGFAPTDTGPYVTALRKQIAKQVAQGMVNRSGGTWAGNFPPEVRARALLEADWEIEHGHSYRVKAFDPPIWREHDLRTGRSHVRVKWRRLIPWIADRFREAAMQYRIWRDRNKINPWKERGGNG